ncbi:LysR substrate-binding domain-containing protein [Paenirhodobacter sp.]|uniref:LysR substrate-binding domain-containing protein n=1 Tax=Paenirhodobacter sp. TaxID=1965326 RepID=UPI003B3F0986
MNFQQIRAFHMVAKEGSVRRAGEILSLSQPTVSQHLKGLEDRYGLRLFEKRGRGIALTETGQQLYSVTERLMAQVEEVEDLLRQRTGSASGRLRVVSDSPAIAVRIVQRMLAAHPDIDVSLRKDSVEGIVAALTELRADVGIAVDPLIGTVLQIAPLRSERVFACLPRGSALAGATFPLEAIAGQVLIQREKTSRTRALVERALAAEGVAPARVIEVEGAEVVREAVALSLGLSFFAESECPPDPRLTYAPVAARRAKTVIVENLLYRRDRRHVLAISAFLEAAREERTRTEPGA